MYKDFDKYLSAVKSNKDSYTLFSGTTIAKLKKTLNKLHLGKFTYILYTIQTLFTLPSGHYKVTFDDGESHEFNKLIFL